MPTEKKRISWIIDPAILADLKECAKKNRRPIAYEAEEALEWYVNQQRREELPPEPPQIKRERNRRGRPKGAFDRFIDSQRLAS